MSHYAILRDVERGHLHAAVPARLRVALPSMSLLPERLAVVVFPSDERSVVTLRQARKALAELGTDVSHAIAVAMGFTEEADAELRRHGVTVARVGGFFWTEESYLHRD